MRAPLLDVELAAETLRECGEEASTVDLRRPDLEVRASRTAERPRAEQRAAKVGGGAAAAGDDAARREAEWPMGTVEHAGLMKRDVGTVRALHVELVARRPVE